MMMRKALILLCTALFLGGCLEQPLKKPPQAEITIEGRRISAVQGSYCWEEVCADAKYSSAFEAGTEIRPVEVPPGIRVKIRFPEEPDHLTVAQWTDEHSSSEVRMKDHAFAVPDKEGLYVYELSARWKEGDASFAFSVEVKE